MLNCHLFAILLLTLLFCYSSNGQNADYPGKQDLVDSRLLPNLTLTTNLTFRHYAGYLKTHENESNDFFYWFFESQSQNPLADPLALWLNGGPGCSSLYDALGGSGPFTLTNDGRLVQNNFTWSQQVNMLYVESPLGVDFSAYQTELLNGSPANDSHTTEANFVALKSFFVKFPHHERSDFYLAGTSYAGIQLAHLGVKILNEQYPTAFRGIALGSALLDYNLNYLSRFHLGYDRGQLSKQSYASVIAACCPAGTPIIEDTPTPDIPLPDYTRDRYENCSALVNYTTTSLGGESHSNCSTLYRKALREIEASVPTNPIYKYYNREQQISERHLVSYLNRADVQTALHVRPDSKAWSYFCNEKMLIITNYTSTVQSHFRQFLANGIRILLYNGDLSLSTNSFETFWFIADLNLTSESKEQNSLTELFDNNHGVVGSLQRIQNGQLTFGLFANTGQKVLKFQPAAGQQMFNDFVFNKNQTVSDSVSE